jgi:hypothetical protein
MRDKLSELLISSGTSDEDRAKLRTFLAKLSNEVRDEILNYLDPHGEGAQDRITRFVSIAKLDPQAQWEELQAYGITIEKPPDALAEVFGFVTERVRGAVDAAEKVAQEGGRIESRIWGPLKGWFGKK